MLPIQIPHPKYSSSTYIHSYHKELEHLCGSANSQVQETVSTGKLCYIVL